MTDSNSFRYLGLIYPLIRMGSDAFVVGFAVWTVTAHLVVWLDLPFETLYNLSFLSLLAILIWFIFSWKSGVANENSEVVTPPVTDGKLSARQSLLLMGVAALLAAALLYSPFYALSWLLTAVFLLISWLAHRKAGSWRPNLEPVISHRWQLGLIFLAMVLALGTVLFVSRPDADDSLFINIAVAAVDHPESAMYARDTLHNIQGGNIIPAYRVQTYELWVAALSRLTAIVPITMAHFWLSLLAALLAVLAIARLMFLFLPKSGAVATLLVVCILLVLRDTHWIYGNFAFVRIFQGKAWFVTIGVPLIVAYAVEYFTQPNRRRWLLLAFSQIAAIGLTANALYAAPLVAGLTLFSFWQPGKTASVRLLKGLSASVYPVLMALLIFIAIMKIDLTTVFSAALNATTDVAIAAGLNTATDATQVATLGVASFTADSDIPSLDDLSFEELIDLLKTVNGVLLSVDSNGPAPPIESMFPRYFGLGISGWLWVFTLIGGWVLIQEKSLRRWILTYSVLVTVLLLSPLWDQYFSKYVTSYALIWRLLWTVPLPAFMALWVQQVFQSVTGSKKNIRYALQLGLGILLLAVVIRTIQNDKRPLPISTQPVILKVPEEDYEIAEEIVRRAKQPAIVLVPNDISPWITTILEHPYPLISRGQYIWQINDFYSSSADVGDFHRRFDLFYYVSGLGRQAEMTNILRDSLDDYDLQLVVVEESNPWITEIKEILESEGYCATIYRDYAFFEDGDFCR